MLRAHTTANENDEERVITGLDKVTAHLKADASKIESVKLKIWLRKEKSVVDALAKLKLNEGVDKALSSPKLKTLDNYVDMFNKKYPEKQVSLLGTLTARYRDDALAKALVTALQVRAMASRKLETMDKYIKLFNLKNPQEKIDLFRALRNGFGGEDKFAILISRAMDYPPTSVGASKYQHILFRRWIAKNYDPMSVLINVFKVGENNLAAASAREQSIIAAYKPIYHRAKGLNNVGNAVDPRRS